MEHVAAAMDQCCQLIAAQKNNQHDEGSCRVVATSLLFNLNFAKGNVCFLLPHKLMPLPAAGCLNLMEFLLKRKWSDLFSKTNGLVITRSTDPSRLELSMTESDDQWLLTLDRHPELTRDTGLWWRLEFIPDPIDPCPICFEPNPDVRTNCKHVFHVACLANWLTTSPNQNCPICRKLLFE
jgi:hypothetical protein